MVADNRITLSGKWTREKNNKIRGGELVGDLGSMLQQIDEANINKEFEDMKKEAEELINKTKEWNKHKTYKNTNQIMIHKAKKETSQTSHGNRQK